MLIGGRYGAGYPVEGIDLPGLDPLLMSMRDHVANPDLVRARTDMLTAYQGEDYEFGASRMIYLPLVANVVTGVYEEVRAGEPDDPLVPDLAVRSITEVVTFERRQRLDALDSAYHNATGARRALTLTHRRRGPIAALAEQQSVLKSAGRIVARERTMVRDVASTLVEAELGAQQRLQMAGIATIAVQHFLQPQVGGERALLARTVGAENWRKRQIDLGIG